MRKIPLFFSLILTCLSVTASSADEKNAAAKMLPFGESGKFKMLYDARQRPQSVFLEGRLYIVYNGDAKPTSNSKGSASDADHLRSEEPKFFQAGATGPESQRPSLQSNHLAR